MADNIIKVNVTATKKQSVNITAGQVQTPIGATADTSQYYSNLSKNWAVSESIVDGVDYSSKYYANKAKENAENAQGFESSAKESYNAFLEASANAIQEVHTTRDEAVANIESSKTEAVDSINNAQNESINSINNSKTTAISDIEFVASGEKEEIEVLSDEIKDNANTVNMAIEAGVERLNSIDALKKSQITNCLLEVPQRIKYTLENGTLTIKAGSVVIVPYGTEDLTADYPVGSTFINDNFKVYDTQFANGKFFVWAELVEDVSKSITTSDPLQNRACYLNLTLNSLDARIFSYSGTAEATEKATNLNYRTDLNIVQKRDNSVISEEVCAFPIGRIVGEGTSLFGYFTQIFNGMGYIGSTVWVDKGVKGLIPNGRNKDGSLNNIEYIENNLRVFSATSTITANYVVAIRTDRTSLQLQQTKNYYYVEGENDLPNAGTSSSKAFVSNENSWYYWHSDTNYTWQKCEQLVLGDSIWKNGVVTSFNTKLPFRAVDHNELQEVQCVVETYVNGTSGYRIWSDGYCEQWGKITTTASTMTVSFVKSFLNTNYNIQAAWSFTNNSDTGGWGAATGVTKKYTDSFICNCASGYEVDWRACGYIS